jgi:hypothetical protein
LSQIGNDQTPVFFDMLRNTTVQQKDSSAIFVRTSGSEKQHCTAILVVTANGRKLPPNVIFKRKILPKGMRFPPVILVRAQDKG